VEKVEPTQQSLAEGTDGNVGGEGAKTVSGVNEDYIFPDNMSFGNEDANEKTKVGAKFKQIYLPLETPPTNLIKGYLVDNKAKSLTMHKFNMDAEKDENNVLQFDNDRIAMKLTEIINMVGKYSKEMYT
jgi:hypothetical protein